MMNITQLEGGCYVVNPEDLHFSGDGPWMESSVISRKTGSRALAQNYLKISIGNTRFKSYPDSDVVLFVLKGTGKINISGNSFPIKPETGIYVKPGEAYGFEVKEALHLIEGVCPEGKATWVDQFPNNFDHSHKKRTVHLSERKMTPTGDRFYQLLVGKKMGCYEVTQFIGSIPKSKAPEHFHLYEEAITILKGKGWMWAGNQKASVKPGSMIFLPKKQPHCLECTVKGGLKLMGIFYPSGSPKVSYKAN